MIYDKDNIFAKILRGEIPCKKVYENEYVLSFYDINPQKKIHVLVIPKGEYTDLDDFVNLDPKSCDIPRANSFSFLVSFKLLNGSMTILLLSSFVSVSKTFRIP